MASPLGYGGVEIFEEETLGVGSYGKVCKAKCGQLPCAAKLLHQTMFQFGDPGVSKFTERFHQEGQFLSSIKHPNIVQYLATVQDPKSGRPVLLMELMEESLTKFLERGVCPPPYHTQLNICYDVALALSYLHKNRIVHRDLSSNNILLMGAGKRAKVTDFGMSRLMDMNPRMTPLTQCPGIAVCMPPETLTDSPHYSDRMDCFSWGVLAVQVMTGNFPDPTDARSFIEDSRYPTGRIIVLVPEVERRKKDIDLIEAGHPLRPVAVQCLRDKSKERLSADELCEQLVTLRREERYTESMQQELNQTSRIGQLEQELEAKNRQIQVKEREVQEMQKGLEEKQQDVQVKDRKLLAKERELEAKDREVKEVQRELVRDIQDKDSELLSKKREMAACHQQLKEEQQVILTKEWEIKACHIQLKEKDGAIRTMEMTIETSKVQLETYKEQIKAREELIQCAHIEITRLNDELNKMKQEVLDKVKFHSTKYEELVARDKVEREKQQKGIKAKQGQLESMLNHSKQQLLAAIQDHQSLEKLIVEERGLFDQSIDKVETGQALAKQEMESLQKELVAVPDYKTEVDIRSALQQLMNREQAIPDYKAQKTEIRAALQQRLKKGGTWYLVDVSWMKQWKRYVGYDQWDQSLAGQESANPGPLDNSNLFKDGTLKKYLMEELDYYLLPESAWDKLMAWYGIRDESQFIPRKVVEHGPYMKHCKVEVYLLEFKLYLHSNWDEIVVKQFSRADTVGHLESEMRRTFSIAADEECRVWHYYMTNTYELISNSTQTLQDYGLYNGQSVVLEVRNKDGFWPLETHISESQGQGGASKGRYSALHFRES